MFFTDGREPTKASAAGPAWQTSGDFVSVLFAPCIVPQINQL
jgi:hypothetical protein